MCLDELQELIAGLDLAAIPGFPSTDKSSALSFPNDGGVPQQKIFIDHVLQSS